MTSLAFWPQYVENLRCLQPTKNEFTKYGNQSIFIYSLAELKDPDSSQKLCVICDFKWLQNLKHHEMNMYKKDEDFFFL